MKDLRPIKDYPGYLINEDGEVYSTKRGKLKKLKTRIESSGAIMIIIRNDDHRKIFLVSKLVLEAFRDNPENKTRVGYLDNNQSNVKLKNLVWLPLPEDKRNIFIKDGLKPIPGYPDYFAKKDGSIYSMQHGVLKKLKENNHNRGYSQVTLFSPSGHSKIVSVHRLIALTWLDPNPDKKQVNHKNGIKTDNRVENLEWCTPQENSLHSYWVLGKKNVGSKKFGKENPNSKPIIGTNLKTGERIKFDYIKQASDFINLDQDKKNRASSIVANLKGKRKTAYGYYWEYDEKAMKEKIIKLKGDKHGD